MFSQDFFGRGTARIYPHNGKGLSKQHIGDKHHAKSHKKRVGRAALCAVALNAVYPFVYAARRGGSVKPGPIQCPDCGESVTFRVERLD